VTAASTGSGDDVLDVVELARTLVRTPSPNPPGDERAVAGVVTEALAALGLPRAEVLALDGTRPNLLVTLDLGPGGRHLVLSGHLDTKPVGDADWSWDPLAADVDGDRLLGLGSADMKGAVAAMLVAAARLARDRAAARPAEPPVHGRRGGRSALRGPPRGRGAAARRRRGRHR
jgi:acetylornithine deacetylase/succinyl-diaminopimelate desuccinylase-like protein